MPIPVSLKAVAEEMDVPGDDWFAYINRETGELTTLRREEMSIVEEGESYDYLPDWEQELAKTAEKVIGSEAYLHLPTKFDIHEYAIMERFCMSLEDDELADILLNAIRGRGAFRRFKDTIYQHGIADEWYSYRQQALEEIAEAWLKSKSLPYVRP